MPAWPVALSVSALEGNDQTFTAPGLSLPTGCNGTATCRHAGPCRGPADLCRLITAAMTCFGRAAAGGAVGAIPSPGNSQAQYRSMQAPLEEYQQAGNRLTGTGFAPAQV